MKKEKVEIIEEHKRLLKEIRKLKLRKVVKIDKQFKEKYVWGIKSLYSSLFYIF